MRTDYEEETKQEEIEKEKRKEFKAKLERERALEEQGGIEISSDDNEDHK